MGSSNNSLSLRRAIAAAIALSASSLPLTYSYNAIAQEQEAKPEEQADDDVADLSDVTVSDDAMRALSNEPSAASFGFAKPLLDTPRTVTFVSEEQLRLFGVSTVEDLSRLVPGTYTTTRYGLQGGISVRGVSADFYYRGMKRLQMQGHVRTVLSAYDNIEVIKGPPSALYGLGKIGGYANLDPKSNRAKTGKYMTEEQGYLQATVGRYDKAEMQFGLGVPFEIAGKTSGVYVVGLLEDSGTFVETVPAKQKFLQATVSVDEAVGPFRLETGGQRQTSITAGGYFTRMTQDLIDNGTYIQGRPMAQLDLNGDGRIGYVETYLGSPVTGSISGNNQALDQRYNLPLDANGNPRKLDSFANSIVGIPQSMKNYLTTGPGANLDCAMANYMRDEAPVMAPGGGSLVSRQLPVGFVLNPCNTDTTKLSDSDYRANGAYEREQNATQHMFYLDLIYDTDPDFTVKNQFFSDRLESFKDSWLPYGENQEIKMWEDKITATKKIPSDSLPDWLSINTLGSINYRETSGFILSSGGDFDYRQDITYTTGANGSATGGFYPNTMFWTQLTDPSYQTGAVNTRDRHSDYSETGVGLMFDIDLFEDINLLLGARHDVVDAQAIDKQAFNPTAGNLGVPDPAFIEEYANGDACVAPGGTQPGRICPGAYLAPGLEYSNKDSGKSWSASLSYKLPWGNMRPYITLADVTILLDGSNNLYDGNAVRDTNLIGEAELKEIGIKGELLNRQMQWTLSAFEQQRSDVQGGADPTIGAFVSSTVTDGVEASVNYQATRKWFIGASAVYLMSKYVEGASNLAVDVSARDLGFQDIVAPNGDIYPAEAFGYGGRTRVSLTDPNNIYDEVEGTPNIQISMNTTYNFGNGFGVLGNVQYFSDSWANRLQTTEIPSATIYNVGATWDKARLHLKFNVYNATDETYFRATNGGNPNMASVMPDMRWEFSTKLDF